ncbi:endonuclease domain-containing protein [Rhodopseudomonas palustris]|uniref:endonuclease domain-containing protein n=1 Tax=Rhodopseudomonas palustris TaxID=1076 RepID=UPI000CEB9EF8|nr:endonuclease domain-containing protein [Rhodopseudomonas palustris]PPQ44681.1 hypothetical protein CKO39_07195 [Rhodopseudomonas palustris]
MASATARGLRKRLTPQEARLWAGLRELKLRGYHFRRRAPIGCYVVDFVCLSAKLVIDADGEQYTMPAHFTADRQRGVVLRRQGFRVLHFWNSDIDRYFDGVMQTVLDALPPPSVRPNVSQTGHSIHEGAGESGG